MNEDEKRDRWTPAAIVVVALGMLIGSPSLLYPYGRDQGLFHYIGREWFVHGAVPYRDTFDLKPPPIYLVYGIVARIFGDAMWGIRLVEWLLLVPLVGFLCASLSSRWTERTPKLRIAFGIYVANLLYFGFFSFWNTAQCEIWCVLASLTGVWIIVRTKLSLHRAAALSGLCAGFAFLMKPPAALMVLVIVVALVAKHRADRRRAILGVVTFGAAALAVLVVSILYFVKAGAYAELVDVVFNYNRAYVKGDREGNTLREFLDRTTGDHNHYDPWATVVHFLALLGAVRGGIDGKDRETRLRWRLAAAFLVTAAIGVFVQAKFYHYHYGLMVAGEALVVLLVLGEMQRWLEASRAKLALMIAAPLVLFVISAQPFRAYAETTLAGAEYVFGGGTREAYADHFREGYVYYFFKDREQIGNWVRTHSNPDDRILVRGFEPTIYITAQRSYGGRFATTHHLNSQKILYRRAEWRAEDVRDIERLKPRFVIARQSRPGIPGWPEPADIDDARWFAQFGYREVEAAYDFVVMERAP